MSDAFDLRWNADMRAIRRWQDAHPGNELTWPDHADMVVWMMDVYDGIVRSAIEQIETDRRSLRPARREDVGPLPPIGVPEIGLPGWPIELVDRIANAIYVGLVNPDLTWWDDLPDEMRASYRRAALSVLREAARLPR